MPQNHDGLVKQHQSFVTLLQQILDLLIVWGVFRVTAFAYSIAWSPNYETAALLAAGIFFLVARHNRLYSSWRGQSISLEIREVCKTWSMMLLAALLIGYGLKTADYYSRKVIATWIVLTPCILIFLRIGVRLSLRYARSTGRNTRSVAIAGSGDLANAIAQNIASNPWMGMNIRGFYDDLDAPGHKPSPNLDLEVVGNLSDLARDTQQGNYDEVYIALPMRAEKQTKSLVRDLGNCSVQVHYVPDIFTFNLFNSRIRDVGGIPTISVYDSPLDSVGRILKRIEDLVLGSIILMMICIPMLFIAIGVKLSSKGPILFKQKRYGLNGEEIWVWKFRTMTVCENGDTIKQATKGDSRITPFGSLLRKTSLDELPQFFNVLQGSMSIVGPRPHAVAHNELYRTDIEGYMLRHLVKPGITGWAQVNGWRGETDTREKMEKRVEHDLHYVRNWSLWFDLKIILMTIFKGFVNKNAY